MHECVLRPLGNCQDCFCYYSSVCLPLVRHNALRLKLALTSPIDTYEIWVLTSPVIIIIIRCQIWNRHWRPCLSKHLCHQTTSKNLNPYFVHLLPSYKDYQEMVFVVCPYRVCLLLYQLKIRIPSLYVYTHVQKIPFASF